MASRRPLALPSTAALSNTLRVSATNPSLPKLLLRLSRSSLLALVQEWLKASNQATCGPVLGRDDAAGGAPYDVAQTLEEVRDVYHELSSRRGGKREVVDRVLEGDWRHGLSLRQLAMVDVQILLDHPTSQRWTARRLEKVVAADDERGYQTAEISTSDELPRLQGRSFVAKLQQAIAPMVKACYYLTRLEAHSLSLLRIQIFDTPYATQASLEAQDALKKSEVLLIAFPDHCNSIYLSSNSRPAQGPGSALALRKIVTNTISRALSSPQKQYTLRNSNLIARSLSAMVFLQGPKGTSAALGGWSIFVEGSVETSPLAPAIGVRELMGDATGHLGRKRCAPEGEEYSAGGKVQKRRCLIAKKRFGNTGIAGDGRGIERFDVRLENKYVAGAERRPLGQRDNIRAPLRSQRDYVLSKTGEKADGNSATKEDRWKPFVDIAFHGSHVFAGIRGLVEGGPIDGNRMPGWMTGEHGISAGIVRDGMMKRRKALEH